MSDLQTLQVLEGVKRSICNLTPGCRMGYSKYSDLSGGLKMNILKWFGAAASNLDRVGLCKWF